jgi:hypothetical protein
MCEKKKIIDLLMYFTTHKSLLNRQIQDTLPFVALNILNMKMNERPKLALLNIVTLFL